METKTCEPVITVRAFGGLDQPARRSALKPEKGRFSDKAS
jgi:hypothetical protein